MAGPELSIIIVNWNGKDFLPDCLRSITENPPDVPYEIVVVDNDSSDGSAEWLASDSCRSLFRPGEFTFIPCAENLGFGNANNLAFEKTATPYVFVLNPDTRITAGAIDQLLRTARSDETIGIVGPKLLNEDGTLQPSVCRYPETPPSIVIDGFRLDRVIPKRLLRNWLLGSNWEHDRRRYVPIVAGAAMLCKRGMIGDVGGFDPAIHMYAEELEWCVRAGRRGWKICFEPDSVIYHLRERSTEQRWSEMEKPIVQEKALIYFQNKSFSKFLNFINSLTRLLVLNVHCLRWRATKRDISVLRETMKLHWQNCNSLLWQSDRIERSHQNIRKGRAASLDPKP